MNEYPEHIVRAFEAGCRESMCEIVAAKRPEDFEILRTFLGREELPNPKWRLRSVSALGMWGIPAVEDDMIGLLQGADERLKCNIINSLGALRTERGLAQTKKFLHDDSLAVRKAVIYSLSKNKSKEAMEQLRTMENTDPSESIRELAKLCPEHVKEKARNPKNKEVE